jgi:TPR repeat protein
MYHNGLGVSQDYKLAMEWYQKAASNGSDVAQNNIGSLYDNGLGVSQDYKLFFFFFV